MNDIKNRLANEPVAVGAFIIALVNVSVLFGVPLNPEQLAGLNTVLTLGFGLFARSKVTPTHNLDMDEDDQE